MGTETLFAPTSVQTKIRPFSSVLIILLTSLLLISLANSSFKQRREFKNKITPSTPLSLSSKHFSGCNREMAHCHLDKEASKTGMFRNSSQKFLENTCVLLFLVGGHGEENIIFIMIQDIFPASKGRKKQALLPFRQAPWKSSFKIFPPTDWIRWGGAQFNHGHCSFSVSILKA